MRVPKYLSPSAISLWQYSVDDYYAKYLSDNKQPRSSQTQPMAIGSAFDAMIKSYLHNRLFGKTAEYDERRLFEEQVDKQHWDWAWEHGKIVFNGYLKAGCAADLLLMLSSAIDEPRFEFVLEDTVSLASGDVPLLGKPDLYYTNNQGARVILDWKVNGYCRAGNTSPMKGYIKLRPGDKIHKDCLLIEKYGILINCAMHLEDGNKSWADQLSIYSWLLGEDIGSEKMIVGIDQITGHDSKIRFASHRLRIKPDYQFELAALISQIWETINSGWIFRDMSEEESAAKCELLDQFDSNSALAQFCS